MKRIVNLVKKVWGLSVKQKIVGGIILLVLFFIISRGQKKPVALTFVKVVTNNISSQVSASGFLDGKKSAVLRFAIPGKLNYLAVQTGDSVTAGQTIASLDSTNLNAAYQEALNNRRNTQAAVDAEHDADKNNGASETFAQKATRTAAEVANDNAYNSVLAAQKALTDANLYCPISGVVVNQDNVNVGQNVTTANLIARVVDFSGKYFDATVDESDIGAIAIGQDVQVTLNAYTDTVFNGKVAQIEPTTVTDSTGAITVTVKIQLTDSRISNIYGLNGNASIITATRNNVLVIPQDALIDDSHVWVKAGKTIEKRTIQTGIKSDTDVEVISGLTQEEEVVTNPSAVTK